MKRDKMQATGAVVWLLLQMTAAYSVIGQIPSDSLFLARDKRSVQSTCNKDVVDNLAKSAKETCSQIDTVDKYIANVQSRQESPIPSFTDRHGFKNILTQYNNDLKKAQGHCPPWRNGENVVGSLKEMVLSAQGFEPKITHELEQNEARVKHLLEKHQDIAQVEAKIAALQQDITEAKEAANLTSIPAVLTHLQSVIKNKEEEINTTMKQHQVTQVRRELTQLVQYLDFVKNSSAEVEGKAETARNKLGIFRDNIIQDAGAFKRSRNNAQQGITKLQQEKTSNNNEINSNTQSVNSLRSKINSETAQIGSLNGQIQRAQNELRNIQDRLNRNIRKTKKKRRFGRWFRFVPVVGWTIGNKFYKDAKKKEQQLAQGQRDLINGHNRMVQNLQASIAMSNQGIASHQARITSLNAKNSQLQQELQHFSQLNGNLQGVENEVNLILPSIASAVEGVSKMRETFDAIKQSLADAVQRANEAKTEAEINNMKYFIYNEIDQLKCKWDDAKVKIVPVGKCH